MQVLFRRLAATLFLFFFFFWVLSNRPGDVTGVCLWSKKHKITITITITSTPDRLPSSEFHFSLFLLSFAGFLFFIFFGC